MWWNFSTTYFFRTFNFKQHLNSANEKYIVTIDLKKVE